MALVPYFVCVLVRTLAAGPNAFLIIAGIAERRCAAGADPFVAALMPSLLFLKPLFQRLHDLFPGTERFHLLHFLGRQIFFRSEEHTSELQSLMRISYAVFCLKKKKLK